MRAYLSALCTSYSSRSRVSLVLQQAAKKQLQSGKDCRVLVMLVLECRRALTFQFLQPLPKLSQKNSLLSLFTPLLIYERHPPSPPPRLTTRSNTQGRMGSPAYQELAITINPNVGNVADSYNVWNNCEKSVSDEKCQILGWLSPLAPRERHWAVSEGRMDGVGNWLLGTNEFEKWHTSEDQDVNPVLFCYGDPGVGKTYLRCVTQLCWNTGGV